MTLTGAINLLASVTLFEMMITIGLGVTLAEVGAVTRDWRLIVRAALANFVLFPLAAAGLLLGFGAAPLVSAGFLIAAVCPGAPYGPPFTAMARGNVVTAIGLMVLLAGASAILAPLLLGLLLPRVAGDGLTINAGKMVAALLLTQFLPLCLGLGLRRFKPALAERIAKPANQLSKLLNLALLTCILIVQFPLLMEVPMRAYGGMLLLVAAGVLIGWALGGRTRGNRVALSIATAVRNVGVGLVIVTGSFPGSAAVTAATVFAIVQTLVMAGVAAAWGRMGGRD